MKKGIYGSFVLALLVTLMLAACSNGTTSTDPDTDNNGLNTTEDNSGQDGSDDANDGNTDGDAEREEVTITFGLATHVIEEDEFDEVYKPLIEERFPHVTAEQMRIPSMCDADFQDVIAADQIPDVYFIHQQQSLSCAHEYGLEYDFESELEALNFDLSVFEPGSIDALRSYSESGGIVALPISSAHFALHYNKELFDRFGVSYPEPGMTWSEVVDLASDLTREEDGVQYMGLGINEWTTRHTLSQFGEEFVFIEDETHEVNIVDSVAHRRYFEMLDQVVSIPGNVPDEGFFHPDIWHYWDSGQVAMWIDWSLVMREVPFEFDITTYPVWEGYEGQGPVPNYHAYMVLNTSEHIQESVEVITYLTSEEFMLPFIRAGETPALVSQEARDQYLQDIEGIENFNTDVLFELSPASPPQNVSKYQDSAPLMLHDFVTEYRDHDLEEFLRIMQETTEIYVEEQQMME